MQPVRRMQTRVGRSKAAYRLRRFWLRHSVRVGLRLVVAPALVAAVVGFLAMEGHLNQLAKLTSTAAQWFGTHEDIVIVGMHVDSNLPELKPIIADAVGVDFPVSPLDLDVAAIRDRIEMLPAVTSVRLHVEPDAMLRIEARARPPAVMWRNEDGLFLLDEDGRVIGRAAHRSDRPRLNLIAGDGAPDGVGEALRIFVALERLGDHLRGLVRVGHRRWTVVLDGGRSILLPAKDAVVAARRAGEMCVSEGLLARSLTVLDMRNPDRPTIRLDAVALTTLGLSPDEAPG